MRTTISKAAIQNELCQIFCRLAELRSKAARCELSDPGTFDAHMELAQASLKSATTVVDLSPPFTTLPPDELGLMQAFAIRGSRDKYHC